MAFNYGHLSPSISYFLVFFLFFVFNLATKTGKKEKDIKTDELHCTERRGTNNTKLYTSQNVLINYEIKINSQNKRQ
jgi:hypothetical protein